MPADDKGQRERGQVVIVMGTAGSGKSTVAKELVDSLGSEAVFLEGDAYHSKANKKNMANGNALTDEDRFPWLDSIKQAMQKHLSENPQQTIIITCSALKRKYRDVLRGGAGSHPLKFLYLKGPKELLADRIRHRQGHFFKLQLLDDQLKQLEEPDPTTEPDVVVVGIEGSMDEVLERAKKALGW